MITCPCNVYPLTPHFYIVKMDLQGYFLIFALKHRLWVLLRTVPKIYVLSKNMKIVKKFQLKFVIFKAVKYRCILHWNVCVMCFSSSVYSVGSGLVSYLSLVMRKPAFCLCENKDADQLHGDCEADQRLCFRYIDSTIPLLPKSEISSLWPSSLAVQPGLCRTRSEIPKTGFLTARLIFGTHSSWAILFAYRNEQRHEKTNVLVFYAARHKPGCTATQDG